MSAQNCPELEALFLGIEEGNPDTLAHARGCPDCAAILEEHRQLEKDLFRLVDPLPPADFTQKVMSKVASAPAPASAELKAGLSILVVSVSLFVTFLFTGGRSVGDVGVGLAHALLRAQAVVVAVGSALQALWGTAALPVIVAALLVLASSLYGLRKLAGNAQSA